MLLHIAAFSNLKQNNIPLYAYNIFLSVHLLIGVLVVYACVLSCFTCVQLVGTSNSWRPCGPQIPVHGILQARIAEWVAVRSSRGSSDLGIEPMSLHWQECSLPLAPPGTPFIIIIIYVLSLSVMLNPLQPHGLQPARLLCPWDSSRQEYWSGSPRPSPLDLLDPEIEPASLTSPGLAGGFLTTRATMVFSVVTYGCESWTIKKAEC